MGPEVLHHLLAKKGQTLSLCGWVLGGWVQLTENHELLDMPRNPPACVDGCFHSSQTLFLLINVSQHLDFCHLSGLQVLKFEMPHLCACVACCSGHHPDCVFFPVLTVAAISTHRRTLLPAKPIITPISSASWSNSLSHFGFPSSCICMLVLLITGMHLG